MATDCIFCKIINGKLPAAIIHEDEQCLAFFDIKPAQAGHTLVVPKEHYQDLEDLPAQLLAHIAQVAQKLAKKMLAVGMAEGINLMHATKPCAQQSVFHFHLHVVPRKEGDGIDLWYPDAAPSSEKVESLVQKLGGRLQQP